MQDDLSDAILRIQQAYPRVYLACHTSHQPVSRRRETLSDKDSRILAHLDREHPSTPAELAEHLRIRRSTLSEALDRLVSRGFISREQRTDDRRRLDLRLTAEGAAAMSESSVLDPRRLETLVGQLSAAERDQAVRGLELLADAAFRLRSTSVE